MTKPATMTFDEAVSFYTKMKEEAEKRLEQLRKDAEIDWNSVPKGTIIEVRDGEADTWVKAVYLAKTCRRTHSFSVVLLFPFGCTDVSMYHNARLVKE